MKKRMFSLLLSLAMLLSLTPAVAANNTTPSPTVEEILSEYHQRAFEIEATGDAAAASYSPRSGSSEKTLEQETVDTLTAAGYEAYNVTSENYDALENQLQTDFSDMGLNPDGSYIVVISGEDPTAASNGSRAAVPTPDYGGGGGGSFNYTYNGVTYSMQYFTVTSLDDPNYTVSSSFDLLSNYYDSFLDRLLDTAVEIYLDAISDRLHLGTISSIIGLSDYTNIYRTSQSTLYYQATTTWTRSYILVWNNFYQEWHRASCVEYADMRSKISGYLFDQSTGITEEVNNAKVDNRIFSSDYFNNEKRKIDAVIGYTSHFVECDVVGSVTYRYGTRIVAYHHQNF